MQYGVASLLLLNVSVLQCLRLSANLMLCLDDRSVLTLTLQLYDCQVTGPTVSRKEKATSQGRLLPLHCLSWSRACIFVYTDVLLPVIR